MLNLVRFITRLYNLLYIYIKPTFRTTDSKKMNIIYAPDYNAGGANGCGGTPAFPV